MVRISTDAISAASTSLTIRNRCPMKCYRADEIASSRRQRLNLITHSLGLLLEHFLGDRRRCDRSRPPRVESEMGDKLAQFVLGHAISQGTLQMTPQLIRPLQSNKRGTSYKVAVALGETRSFPYVSSKRAFSVRSTSLGTTPRMRSKDERR
jgi:hypothetical protein